MFRVTSYLRSLYLSHHKSSEFIVSRRDEIRALRARGLSYTEIALRMGITREQARRLAAPENLRVSGPANPRDMESMLTPTQAANYLSVHVNTLRRWSDVGKLPAMRLGSRGDRRFRRRDVEALLSKD